MQPLQPDYKIYPSLLDAYKWYQASESDTSEQEFIDKINRLPYQSDAADKGKWLNELIDISLKGQEKYKCQFLTGYPGEIVKRLAGAVKQVYTSTMIEVGSKIVELYGYIDYVKEDRVIDLKTTKTYELGKYKDSLQMHLYPVSLIDEGNEINEFEFLVTDFENIYSEVYKINYANSKAILTDCCKELINFLRLRRHLITDRKIFNEQVNISLAYKDMHVNATIIEKG